MASAGTFPFHKAWPGQQSPIVVRGGETYGETLITKDVFQGPKHAFVCRTNHGSMGQRIGEGMTLQLQPNLQDV